MYDVDDGYDSQYRDYQPYSSPPHQYPTSPGRVARASSSRLSTSTSAYEAPRGLPPAPYASVPKKRGRPLGSRNLVSGRVSTASGSTGQQTPKSRPKAAGTSSKTRHLGAIEPDKNCSFCGGTDERNKELEREKMVSCVVCGRSGHPSCLKMTTRTLCAKVHTYPWHCIECKYCEVCGVKGVAVSRLFGDGFSAYGRF
jgi:hypothetical protein